MINGEGLRPRIGVLLGSTRPNSRVAAVAAWVVQVASVRADADFQLIRVSDHDLPLLDETWPPFTGRYQKTHTQQWARVIGGFDGFIIVTPEYNHTAPAALTNAMSYLFAEWTNKAVGFVSYGTQGGVRAVEHLRGVAGELMMADVRAQVALSFTRDWIDRREFRPADSNVPHLHRMLDQVIAWTNALAPLRVAGEPAGPRFVKLGPPGQAPQ